VAALVLAGRRSEKRPPKAAVFELMSKGLSQTHADRVKTFAANETCIGCGTCVQVCPRGNIQLVGNKPEFGSNCIGCLSCVQFCPKQALNIGKITEKRERFPNPRVTPAELTKEIIHID
jgi:ferredoxin